MGTSTPWGSSDSSERLAPGIVFYTTPSHGGIHLTPKREAELDAKLREVGMSAEEARMGYEPGWYEEDCCILAVIYAWPELFPKHDPDTGFAVIPDTPETVATRAAESLDRLRYWTGYHERQSWRHPKAKS